MAAYIIKKRRFSQPSKIFFPSKGLKQVSEKTFNLVFLWYFTDRLMNFK